MVSAWLATSASRRSARAASTYLGALFTINARGEPIELVYNALRDADTRCSGARGDLRRHAERGSSTTSLLSVAESEPRAALLSGRRGRRRAVCAGHAARDDASAESRAPGGTASSDRIRHCLDDASSLPQRVPDSVHVFWSPSPPARHRPPALFEQLRARGLLLEPFDRAADALREIYGPRTPAA